MSTRRDSRTGRTIYKHAPRAADRSARVATIACVAMMPVALIVSVFV